MQTICNKLLWFVCAYLVCFPLTAADAPKLRVLTTFLPLYCLAANVAGDLAEVSNLLPPGEEPHDYQLSPGDLRKISESDIIFESGLGVESWLQKALRPVGRAPLPVLKASDALKGRLISTNGTVNPHFWLDPQLAALVLKHIANVLGDQDAAHRDRYILNANAATERFARIDEELAGQLKTFQQKKFVTYHDAFPYFSRRYGLQVIGVVEAAPDVPPSPRQLARLNALIRSEHVVAMFSDRAAPSRLASQICRDLQIKRLELSSLEFGPLELTTLEKGWKENARAFQKLNKP
jgi:zinc transport system substrate-binding protein